MNFLKKKYRNIKKRLKNYIKVSLPSIFFKTRITSILYYIFLSRSFDREIQSVLAGKAKHLREMKFEKENYYLLVRNTHRLEKGLLMRPRRDIFAKGYIRETVDSYIRVMSKMPSDENDQIGWFTDVLTEYFNVIGSDREIDHEKARFLDQKNKVLSSDISKKKIPYIRSEKEKSSINFEDFYLLSRQRRSVRWFADKAVPRELIDKALLAALQAPSACNRQPFEFRIFDEPEKVQQIANLPMGTSGYAQNINTIIVVVGNLDAYFSERDRHVIYIDASLASMSFMYALETLGLSSCPINWPDIKEREEKMAQVLGLGVHQRPIMLLAVGYPHKDGKVAYSEKRSLDMIRTYNE